MNYINFETNNVVNKILEEDINPSTIIKNLEIIFGRKIEKDKTLIFFDEIQINTRTLSSLKYFFPNNISSFFLKLFYMKKLQIYIMII